MSMDNLSLGVIRPPLKSSVGSGKRLNSKLVSKTGRVSEHESEDESETESDDEPVSEKAKEELEFFLNWESKPIEYMQEKFDDNPFPCVFAKNFSYKNPAMLKKEEDSKKAVAEYLERSEHLSPFDAIPIPHMANLCGNNFPGPIPLREYNRPHFIRLSKIALDYYNHDYQGLNYVFEDIIKVTGRRIPLSTRYITFKAKPNDFIQPAVTFQAEVWDRMASLGPPIVNSCSIKT